MVESDAGNSSLQQRGNTMILSNHLVTEIERAIEEKRTNGYDEKLQGFLYEAMFWYEHTYGRYEEYDDGSHSREKFIPDEHLVDILDICAAFRTVLIRDMGEISNDWWECMIQFCRFGSPFGKPGKADLGMNWIKKMAKLYSDEAEEHAKEIADYSIVCHQEFLTAAANWQKLVDIFNRDNG